MSWRRIRRYLLTGLVVLAPVGATALILAWLFRTLDGILGDPLRRILGWNIPGLGVLLLFITVLVLGWLATYTLGHQLIAVWNRFLGRFPLTATIYNASSQIVQTFVGEKRRIFLRAVLVPYPTEHSWALGWVTSESSPFAEAVLGEPCLHVFLASTPNPTTGWILIVPASRTHPVDLSVEEGMKLILSGGVVQPRQGGPEPGAGLDLESLLRRTNP
jgi:uncharacterized membrane protein